MWRRTPHTLSDYIVTIQNASHVDLLDFRNEHELHTDKPKTRGRKYQDRRLDLRFGLRGESGGGICILSLRELKTWPYSGGRVFVSSAMSSIWPASISRRGALEKGVGNTNVEETGDICRKR